MKKTWEEERKLLLYLAEVNVTFVKVEIRSLKYYSCETHQLNVCAIHMEDMDLVRYYCYLMS